MKCRVMIDGATFGVWILAPRSYPTNVTQVKQVLTSSDGIFCSVGGLDASIGVDPRTMLSLPSDLKALWEDVALPQPSVLLRCICCHMYLRLGLVMYITPISSAPQSDDMNVRIDCQQHEPLGCVRTLPSQRTLPSSDSSTRSKLHYNWQGCNYIPNADAASTPLQQC